MKQVRTQLCRQQTHALVFALAVIWVGVWFRFHDASAQLLGGDELHAITRAARLSYGEILRYYGASDNSVPLTLYARFLMKTVGLTELAFRAPVMLAGFLLLLSPLFFLRRLGLWPSLSALALFATSPPMVYFALLARPYAPAALLIVLALLSWEYWLASGRLSAGMGFALAGAMAIFFHLFCLFPIATLAALSIFEARHGEATGVSSRQIMLCLALLLGLLALFFGPGLPQLIVSRAAKLDQTELRYPTLLLGYRHLVGILPLLQISLLLLVPMGVLSLAHHSPRLARAAGLVVCVQLAAICLTRPSGGGASWARYYYVVWPVFLILSAVGITQGVRVFIRILPNACTAGLHMEHERAAGTAGGLLALGIALWLPAASPALLYRLPHTSFRTAKAALARVRPLRQGLPPLFRRIAAEPERGGLLIVPYGHRNESWARLALYEQRLGMRIKMASGRTAIDRRRGIRLANVLDAGSTDALIESGANYLILDPQSVRPSVTEHIRERFGAPLSNDGRLELYRLGPY